MSWWDPTRPSPAERPALALASGPPELPLMPSPPRQEHFRSASLQTAPLGNSRFPLRVRLSARTRLPLRPGWERARSRRSTSEAWRPGHRQGQNPAMVTFPNPFQRIPLERKCMPLQGPGNLEHMGCWAGSRKPKRKGSRPGLSPEWLCRAKLFSLQASVCPVKK